MSLIVACCVCGAVRDGDRWDQRVLPRDVPISHGYCPHCAEEARAELERFCEARRLARSA